MKVVSTDRSARIIAGLKRLERYRLPQFSLVSSISPACALVLELGTFRIRAEAISDTIITLDGTDN
jgi:hypothetical protein